MVFHPRDFQVGGAQVHFAWNDFEPLVGRRFYFFKQAALAEQDAIRARALGFFQADAAGRVCLRVEVKKQNTLAEGGKAGGKVDGGGRFPDSALLVGDGDDFGWHLLIKRKSRRRFKRAPRISERRPLQLPGSVKLTGWAS